MNREIFWLKALKLTKEAINKGALIPLETKIINNNSNLYIPFEIRYLISDKPDHLKTVKSDINPFLPWDKRLEISQINNSHILILNKYPVQLGHMLLITNDWQPQNGWLRYKDMQALATVNNDTTGLWFFNSSPEAGASQPHRHIQLLRRNKSESMCPRNRWFLDLITSTTNTKNILASSTKVLPLNDIKSKIESDELYNKYIRLCIQIGIGDPNIDDKPKNPYNLIITPEWIAVVKRCRDCVKGISINALGFAGYLLATKDSDMEWLERNGPVKLLERVVDHSLIN